MRGPAALKPSKMLATSLQIMDKQAKGFAVSELLWSGHSLQNTKVSSFTMIHGHWNNSVYK